VVKLIVDKEKEIESFMKNDLESYYKVNGEFKHKKDDILCQLMRNKTYEATESESESESGDSHSEEDTESEYESESESGSNEETESESDDDTEYKGVKAKIKSRPKAQDLMKKISKSTFKVGDIAKKERTRNPSPPFTTSTLQQEASRKLGFSVKQTMSSAQKLYEEGYITYMRTDSVNLSKEAIDKIAKFVKSEYGNSYLNIRNYKSRSKNTQEAHEAVRPSDVDKKGVEMKGKIGASESSLYNLIWKRAVASQMAAAKFNVTNINIDISKVDEYYFTSEMSELKYPGFLKVYNYKNLTNDNENIVNSVPKKGTKLMASMVKAMEDYSRPPTRFNEASLVNKLDPKNLNIGRPSTYAATIDKIQSKKYVIKGDTEGVTKDTIDFEWKGKSDKIVKHKSSIVVGKDNNKLMPTDMGLLISKFLEDNFTHIMQYDFTAKMEDELDDIAEGSMKWDNVLSKFYKKFHPLVEKAGKKDIHILDACSRTIGNDPDTGDTFIATIGAYGPYIKKCNEDGKKIGTAPIRKPYTIKTITLDATLELFEWPKELGKYKRNKVLYYREGRYGPYVKVGKDQYLPLKKEDGEYYTEKEVDIELVEKMMAEKEKSILWEDSKDGIKYTVKKGPYGMYAAIKNTKTKKKAYNAKLNDDIDLKKLTIEKLNEHIESRKRDRYNKRKTKKDEAEGTAKGKGGKNKTVKKTPTKKGSTKKKPAPKKKKTGKK
jgi:DNA topoisomerase-1